MNSKIARIITDLAMFVVMCFIIGTGLLIHYRLQPGFMGGHGLTVLGLSRHEWGIYHLWAAYNLIFLLGIHLVLNYAFIKNCVAAKRTWIVIGLGLIGAAFISVFLLLPVERRDDASASQGHGLRTQERQGHQGQGKVAD